MSRGFQNRRRDNQEAQVPTLPTVPAKSPPPTPAEATSQTQLAAPPPAPGADQSEIVVNARSRAAPGDPLERLNIKSFEAVQAVDKALVDPDCAYL